MVDEPRHLGRTRRRSNRIARPADRRRGQLCGHALRNTGSTPATGARVEFFWSNPATGVLRSNSTLVGYGYATMASTPVASTCRAYRQLLSGQQPVNGYWRVFLYAQDTNGAAAGMDPTQAATHIGGFPIASATKLSFDPTLPCPLTADAAVLVAI